MPRVSKVDDMLERLTAGAVRSAAPAIADSVQAPRPAGRSGAGRRRRGAGAGATRYTVDLEDTVRVQLHSWALHQRVDCSEVVRTLIVLLEDELVARMVIDRLEAG